MVMKMKLMKSVLIVGLLGSEDTLGNNLDRLWGLFGSEMLGIVEGGRWCWFGIFYASLAKIFSSFFFFQLLLCSFSQIYFQISFSIFFLWFSLWFLNFTLFSQRTTKKKNTKNMDDEDDKSRTFTPNLTLKKRSIRVLCGYLGMKY